MSEWQPIETAPKDGTWVLLTTGGSGYENIVGPCVVGFWCEWTPHDSGWAYCYWDDGWGSGYEEPTHWMPLPEPPK